MKALIFAEGNGFGHASRDSIIQKLLGYPIMTFGAGARYCKENNLELIEIPAPYEIKTEAKGVKIVTNLSELMRMVKPEVTKTIKSHFKKYDMIIVDGSPMGLIIAMAMGKPTVFISNDTASLVGVQGMISRKIAGSLYKEILSYPKAIIVPDFSPPLTITKKNLDISLPLQFCGPLVKKRKQIRHKKKYVVAGRLEERLKPILGSKAIYANEVEHPGHYLEDAELLICHGGHTSMMEALSFGKPVLVIEDPKYQERYNNGLMLVQNDVGTILESSVLTIESLLASIEYSKTLNKKRLELYKKNSKLRILDILKSFGLD